MTNEALLRAAIVAEAETWLRTPYHHQAAVKGHGVDCAQILIEVYAAVGLAAKFDAGYYPSDWMLHRSEERYLGNVEQYCTRTEVPLPGDIALFKFGRCFSHSAIVVDYPSVIHAQREDGCCYANAEQGSLAGREVLFYTFFGAGK